MDAQPECPCCGHHFDSHTGVINHLNNPVLTCIPPGQRDVPAIPSAASQTTSPHLSSYLRYHRYSGYTYPNEGGKNIFEQMEEDSYAYRRRHNVYYPFADHKEWELAKFLHQFTQAKMDEFLKLEWVNIVLAAGLY